MMPAKQSNLMFSQADGHALGPTAQVLTDIYRDDVNMAVWQRPLPEALSSAVNDFLQATTTSLKVALNVSSENAFEKVNEALGATDKRAVISEDIAHVVDMFCCLFELETVGLRLVVLKQAMCPKFHVDHVPCRLITTYQGQGTQWLANSNVDRSKLGRGSLGLSDAESGIMLTPSAIEQLQPGHVALLKGEKWLGNEGAGLVHRSPSVEENESRLLLTLDFVNQ